MTKERSTILATAVVTVAICLTGFTCLVASSGCDASWNKPHADIPEPGNPCLYLDWHSCGVRADGKHACCYAGDDCRPNGGCAWGGLENPTSWGSAKDAGVAEYPQQTPEQIRRSRGRQ